MRHEVKRLCHAGWSENAAKPVITRDHTLSLQSTLTAPQLDFFMVSETMAEKVEIPQVAQLEQRSSLHSSLFLPTSKQATPSKAHDSLGKREGAKW